MAEDFKDAIETFVLVGRQAGWTKGTVKSYRFHIGRLAMWLERRGVTTVDGLTARLLLEFGSYQRDRWAANTTKVGTIAIRSFLRTLAEQGLCDPKLAMVLKVPRIKQRIQRTVTGAEVAAMLASLDTPYRTAMTDAKNHALRLRNKCVIALLFDSMLRASELCSIRLADTNVDTRVIVVRQGKGDRDGRVRFSEATAEYLRAWLEIRPFVALASCDFLFCGVTGNTPGEKLSRDGLKRIVSGISQRAGVAVATPHAFRRGGAVQAIRNGASSRIVQDMGRWEHISMIETYTRALQSEDLYDDFAPMNSVGPKKPTADLPNP